MLTSDYLRISPLYPDPHDETRVVPDLPLPTREMDRHPMTLDLEATLRGQISRLLEATPALKAIGLAEPDWRARLARLVGLAGLEEENKALKAEVCRLKADILGLMAERIRPPSGDELHWAKERAAALGLLDPEPKGAIPSAALRRPPRRQAAWRLREVEMFKLKSGFQNHVASLFNGILIGVGLALPFSPYGAFGLLFIGGSILLTFLLKYHVPDEAPLFCHRV